MAALQKRACNNGPHQNEIEVDDVCVFYLLHERNRMNKTANRLTLIITFSFFVINHGYYSCNGVRQSFNILAKQTICKICSTIWHWHSSLFAVFSLWIALKMSQIFGNVVYGRPQIVWSLKSCGTFKPKKVYEINLKYTLRAEKKWKSRGKKGSSEVVGK